MIDINTINAEGTTLRKHQMKMLEMMEYVDEVCRKNNIRYYLSGGTLLGAVRHKGFIPWDDDLDIILLKKDLERLHTLLLKDVHPRYLLQANDTDSNYLAPYEKLRMLNTLIRENNDGDHFYKYKGIYIDLFYLEPALPVFHVIADKLQTRLINLSKSRGQRAEVSKVGLRFGGFILKKLIFPSFSFISSVLNPHKISYPLGSFFHTQFEREWLSTGIELEFEGRKFFVPSNYDAMLRAQYGDYMKVPSPEEITTHINFVQFEDSEK